MSSSEEGEWIWIERISSIPFNYFITSLIIGFIIYFIFLLFIILDRVVLNINIIGLFLPFSIMIAFEIAGIKYLLEIMNAIIVELSLLYNDSIGHIQAIAKKRFTGSRWFYVLLIFVILPFYLIDIISILKKEDPYSSFEGLYLHMFSNHHTTMSLLCDLYGQLIAIIFFYLLVVILWCLINIMWTLRIHIKDNYYTIINSLSVRRRVTSITDLILKALKYYFLCMSFAIILFIDPKATYIWEIFYLVILLLIGGFFFFYGMNAIQEILKYRIENELTEIDKICQEQFQLIIEFASNNEHHMMKEELSYHSDMIDVLQKRKALIECISSNVYDISSVSRFIGRFLLPIITTAIKNHSFIGSDLMNISLSGSEILHIILNNQYNISSIMKWF
jgi:hypothetical protein